jgi:hypothetical protein
MWGIPDRYNMPSVDIETACSFAAESHDAYGLRIPIIDQDVHAAEFLDYLLYLRIDLLVTSHT